MLQYLRGASNFDNLRRLELNVGGDLIDYMVYDYRSHQGWVLSPRVEEEIEEFVATIGHAVNLEVLLLRWRLTNDGGTGKVKETLSRLTSRLSRFEHLTTLHLESFVYVSLQESFLTASCLRGICQMGQLQHLKLAGIQLTNENAFVFADELPKNTTLETLDLDSTRQERLQGR